MSRRAGYVKKLNPEITIFLDFSSIRLSRIVRNSRVILFRTTSGQADELKSGENGNFWIHFFTIACSFSTFFYFWSWIHTNADRIVSDFFKYERDRTSLFSYKVIAAAAHANTTIEYEERKLLEYFLSARAFS